MAGAHLWVPTFKAAMVFAAGHTPRGTGVSATAFSIAESLYRSLHWSSKKLVLAVLLVGVNLAATTVSLLAATGCLTGRSPDGGTGENQAAPHDGPDEVRAIISGRVLDDAGEPVANANVDILTRHSFQPGENGFRHDVLRRGTTDKAGRFQIAVPTDFPTWNSQRKVNLWASAPGHGPTTATIALVGKPTEIELRLAPNRPLRGRLNTPDGKPAAGVRLAVVRLGTILREPVQLKSPPRKGTEDEATIDLWPEPAVTNAEGEFEFPRLGRTRNTWLQVQDERFATYSFPAEMGGGEPIDGRPYFQVVQPGQIVEGTVTASDSGEPVPYARLTVFTMPEELDAWRQALHTTAQDDAPRSALSEFDARADAEGRYRIRLPSGRHFRIAAYGPVGLPYVAVCRAVDQKDGLARRDLSFVLPRGTLLTGHARDAATRHPIAGAFVSYVPAADNSHRPADAIGDRAAQVVTGPDGRFDLPALPGRGRVVVRAPGSPFLPLPPSKGGSPVDNVHGVAEVDVPEKGPVDAIEVLLRPGVTLTGQVVDTDGKPATGAVLLSGQHLNGLFPVKARPLPVSEGKFALPACESGRNYRVVLFEPGRLLAGVADLSADAEPPVVRMRPCGQVTLRLVDQQAKPIASWRVVPFVHFETAEDEAVLKDKKPSAATPTQSAWLGPQHHDLSTPEHTDAEGRVTLKGLVPGVRYTIVCGFEPRTTCLPAIIVKPGESLRLPDVVIER